MDQKDNIPQPDQPIEVLSADAISAIERGQFDIQIATARKYPRSLKAFMQDAEGMISLNQEIAEGCNYKLKRKDKDGGIKFIEGPSIRLLEIAANAYGNLRFGSRIIGIDDEFVTAQGMAFDLQKNVAATVEVKRSIRTSKGARYGTDMIMVTANAAGSIARRNALNGVIPRSYVMELAEFAKKTATGDVKLLPERLQRAFEYFTKTLGVEPAKVLAYLEKPSLLDCGIDDLEKLQGLKTAIKEGDVNIDDAFSDKPPVGPNETPDLEKKK